MNKTGYGTLLACMMIMSGCTTTNPPKPSTAHLNEPMPRQADIPSLVTQAPVLPPPRKQARQETYTVVVNEVPVKDLLFSLARDARLDVDIHPGIEGVVTLNAVNQTLAQILDRISKQVSLRIQMDGPNLIVSPDTPYWRTYAVGYVNMARDSESEVSVATQIATAGGSVSGSAGSSRQGNVSQTKVKNSSSNDFWAVIEANIIAIVEQPLKVNSVADSAKDDAAKNDTSEAENSSEEEVSPVVVNAASGVISVNTGQQQHRQIQAFLDQVLTNALRQVLIEMTIVEVELGDRYQAGVDWQNLASGDGLTILSTLTGSNLSVPPVFSLSYSNTTPSGSSYSTTLRMLETFGDVKVLSSPKIMALNNQTALLKVVDEKVYFTVEMEIENATQTTPERRTFLSEIHTVPVGLVMSVTPQINEVDSVSLNIRPTISRITGYAVDPAPRLANSGFDNLIPEIQVREMESLLQISNGQMVVMGGLMQDKTDKNDSGVPYLSKLPLLGSLFRYRDDEVTKSELVIFLRPTVIKSAGVGFDLANYSEYLQADSSHMARRDVKGAP